MFNSPNRAIKILLVAISIAAGFWLVVLSCFTFFYKTGSNTQDLTETHTEKVAREYPYTKIEISPSHISPKEIQYGDTLEAVFNIKNIGCDSLFILDILPDCTCTQYELSSHSCAQAETITLAVRISTKDKQGENVIHIVLKTNTAERMTMLKIPFLVLDGINEQCDDADDALEFISEYDIGQLSTNITKSIPITLTNTSLQNHLLSISTSCSCLSVSKSILNIASNGREEFITHITPTIPGDYDEYLLLRDTETNATYKITFSGFVTQTP